MLDMITDILIYVPAGYAARHYYGEQISAKINELRSKF